MTRVERLQREIAALGRNLERHIEALKEQVARDQQLLLDLSESPLPERDAVAAGVRRRLDAGRRILDLVEANCASERYIRARWISLLKNTGSSASSGDG